MGVLAYTYLSGLFLVETPTYPDYGTYPDYLSPDKSLTTVNTISGPYHLSGPKLNDLSRATFNNLSEPCNDLYLDLGSHIPYRQINSK